MTIKKLLFLLTLTLCAMLQLYAGNQKLPKTKELGTSERRQININREWRFTLGDFTGAEQPSFKDEAWTLTHLPHSFSIPYFMWKGVYNGYGWYRKEIEVPNEWKNKQISIEFEGIFIQSEVFLNGKRIGEHVGGYTGFCCDLTPFIKPGKNILAVRVNNLWKADVAPRAGDHQFSGGIYRDVYLHITNPLHVAWKGSFVSTPAVSKKEATVIVQTEVCNESARKSSFQICTKVVAPNGKIIASTESSEQLAANSTKTIEQTLPRILSPQLWHPETPHLYKAYTTIRKAGKVVDETETTFGIRWFEWSADKGFFLNGEHLYLLGANVHQDHAGWGDAVTNAGFYRDVLLMKQAGFNTIRGSHYPHDPAFSQACDELGMLFFPENALWGMGGSSGDRFSWGTPSSGCYPPDPKDQNAFDTSVITQLKELIRIHRNSPSITAWSLSNEAFFTDKSTLERVKKLLNTATDSIHLWDKTRLVAIGGCQRGGLDKLGKNQIAFYNGDGATFPAPGVPSMVSEYGSITTHRPGKFAPGWGDIKDGFVRPTWRGGQVIWCGFDHGTVGGEGLAIMGIVDYFRIPKRSWYWYREVYAKGNSEPVEPRWAQPGIPAGIRLTADKHLLQAPDGTDDAHLLLTIIDKDGTPINNEIPVTLTIVSGPGEFPTGRSIRFMPPSDQEASDITIRDGLAAIEFRSYYAGTTVIEATAEGIPSSSLTITTQGTPTWESCGKPLVSNRLYRRYTQSTSGITTSGELLLANNRPTAVSSTAEGFNKSWANDGDLQSSWKAAATDTKPWWSVDLEASYDISNIEIDFATEAKHSFIIEVTSDNQQWTTVVDKRNSPERRKKEVLQGDFGKNIRAVRIRFTSAMPDIAEFKIGGKP